ncbi:hypothetical protein FF38_08503 [Lucilia cuprina]|uniref:Uncharacterized protein n=1 Tax=Lucilia cuprina TaxID=7375 RepID=A0A0L0CCF1_LUCCU|nr:hypothetical protein FF38_08503 [Lucilia cuprina]
MHDGRRWDIGDSVVVVDTVFKYAGKSATANTGNGGKYVGIENPLVNKSLAACSASLSGGKSLASYVFNMDVESDNSLEPFSSSSSHCSDECSGDSVCNNVTVPVKDDRIFDGLSSMDDVVNDDVGSDFSTKAADSIVFKGGLLSVDTDDVAGDDNDDVKAADDGDTDDGNNNDVADDAVISVVVTVDVSDLLVVAVGRKFLIKSSNEKDFNR